MALSNWDTIAWDEKGEPCLGSMECPDGSSIEIRKNWAHISDPKAFRSEGSPFTADVIIQIWHGSFQYRRLCAFAKRGPQESVFLVAIYQEYEPKVLKELFAIGAYGYSGNKWTGIKPTTIDEYKLWLRQLGNEDEIDAAMLPELKPGLRYNQGDAYFANHLGEAVPGTPPGEAKDTILSQMLDRVEEKAKGSKMTTEQELRIKMAKFAGDFDFTPDGRYEAPDGEWNLDFPNDLNACFKWLFKPLCDYLISESTTYEEYQNLLANFLVNWVKDFVFDQTKHNKIEPGLEATALCRAIEQLIDKPIKEVK